MNVGFDPRANSARPRRRATATTTVHGGRRLSEAEVAPADYHARSSKHILAGLSAHAGALWGHTGGGASSSSASQRREVGHWPV